jgi:diguanylate cyclase (GGDEF)-like protein
MTGRRQPLGRADRRALLISLALALLTVGLVLVAPEAGVLLDAGGPEVFLLIAAGFLVAERFIFNVEYRQHAFGFSLSEVPAAFAIVLLDPLSAVLARMLGSGLILITRVRRTGFVKPLFNISLFAFEIALAATLLRSITALSGTLTPLTGVLAVAISLFAASMMGAFFVSWVIAQYEGGLTERLRSELGHGYQVWVLGAILGASTLAPALVDPWLALLPLLPIVLVWRLYMAHGDLRQRHHDLTALHDFTRAVGGSLDLSTVVRTAQGETQRLLRARQVGLVVFDPDGAPEPAAIAHIPGVRLPSTTGEPAWKTILEARTVVRVPSAGDDAHPVVAGSGWTDALAVSVHDAQGPLGLLVVADRSGAQSRFSSDDLERMQALADQLAVSLRKGLLHIRLEHEATHDRLTGLPNRALLERSITRSLARWQSVAVFLLDLDRFKEVNDGLGHHVGDVLLQKFADRVGSIVGPGAVVSRLAGDEFAIMASGMTRHQAGELGSRILAAARDPFDLGELSVAVSCSIGLAIGPAHGDDATTLLRRADLAMYEAKGRSGGVSLYREDLETTSTQRLRLLQDLRVAAVDEQMQAWFQPKIHLRTNAVVGVETLVRWHHPDQGVLEAERFIGLAEQTDLIHTITDRMLTSALVAARSWRRRGWSLGVAVNVSARSLLDELLADRIARHLHQHDVPAEMLTIEITETSVMADVSRALVTLDRLNALGVQLSVDDYGTGYSSLTYLRKLPVSELKIDRGFIANMLTDEHDEVIVRSTIDLGRHLGLRVVAEGIESEEVASKLRDLGCDIGQGSGFAAPLPAAELECWLAAAPYTVPKADGDSEALATA